ncbi:MAG: hypothetical protein L0Y50_04460 [Beijerinckiaceae bacterium]|nr:hypothetical protein [Beijerinckiaceae bacterium]
MAGNPWVLSTMKTSCVIFSKPVLPIQILPAILLAFLANPAHAVPDDCGGGTLNDPQEKILLARAAAAGAKLNFIAGPGKQTPACPSAESACKLKAFPLPGDDVLVIAGDGPYVCATFKSPGGIETSGWLARAALQIVPPEPAPPQQWEGKWRRDGEAEILLKSRGDALKVSGEAMWGSGDPQRVKRGAVHTGELGGEGTPRDQTLAIGYDPGRSRFPPAQDGEDCAARLRLLGRYLTVEDNGACGGMNVSFTGLYVRVPGH